ncbi:hypothetical protein [Agromyces sp. Root81]|uniref:hypothetical protein n=1 Tax=Agromyces sp. Root81 TaxID=1736601 RepID=UPI000ADB8E45|nr:hypothetical protein [Agromyces sp. Root81]
MREDLPVVQASAEQQSELKGGVEAAEYQSAFGRFQSCMAKAGAALSGVKEAGPLMNYRLPAEAYDTGDFDRCYLSEFQQVDERWQYQNKDVSPANIAYKACLEAAGIAPKQASEDVWAQLLEAGLDPEKCATEHAPE